ncbi:MAG: multidrug effflux MFS transporter [Roseovarius sp.]
MSHPHPARARAGDTGMGQVEFVALMAMLVATVAFSTDAMLPALPGIGAELTPEAVNRAQLIVGAFILGLGGGTFVVGPLSDSFGRKSTLLGGAALYVAGSLLALLAPSLGLMLAARVLQGLGAAAARIVAMAIIRDLYAGRQMAQLVSLVMLVFTLVPAIAPLAGSGIIALFGWRGIFGAFVLFAAATSLWMALRLSEPLPPERRRPFRPRALWAALREVLARPMVRLSIAVQTLCYTTLFASLVSIQPIFDKSFGLSIQFPCWFAAIALVAGTGSFVNAALVIRLGMRRMVRLALGAQLALSGAVLAMFLVGLPPGAAFAIYLIWQTSVFFQAGLTLGNLNALAMEPLGHIAGMGASITSGLATVGSVLLSAPLGLAFDGTPVPLLAGVLAAVAAGLWLMRHLDRAAERPG